MGSFYSVVCLKIVHKKGKLAALPDGLSRRPFHEDNLEEQDIREFDEVEQFIKSVNIVKLKEEDWEQVGFWKNLKSYLENLVRPENISDEEFKSIKNKVDKHFVKDGKLWRRSPPVSQLVVSSVVAQDWILEELHENLGHTGEEETYRRVIARFWWPSVKKAVKLWVRSCEAGQKRSSLTPEELGHATGDATLFGRISMDAVQIKAGGQGYKYLIVARDDLSGWVEAQALQHLKASKTAEFLRKEWIYRFGSIKMVTIDGGAEFKDELASAVKNSGAKLRLVTPYYPQGSGMIERGHRPIKDALDKFCGESGKSC